MVRATMIIMRGRRYSIFTCFVCFIGGCTIGSWISIFYQIQNHGELSSHSHQKGEYPSEPEVLLAILIMSAPANVIQRDVLRSTWLRLSPAGSVAYYFVIGVQKMEDKNPTLLNKLRQEQIVQNDLILLDNLEDSYRSLTTKLILGIDFLSLHVPFHYLLKCDDDSFVRVDQIVSELEARQYQLRSTGNNNQEEIAKKVSSMNNDPDQNCYYWGFFDGRAKVFKTGKWKELGYNLCDFYIPYALGGGYVLSRHCTKFILKNRNTLKRFVNEDASVGLWLSIISPERRHDVRFDTEFESRGCSNQYLIQHKIGSEEMIKRYHSLTRNGHLCPKEFRRRGSYEYNWKTVPSQCCKRNSSII